MEENEQALSYIENCVKGLNTSFTVSSSCQFFNYFVRVLLDGNESVSVINVLICMSSSWIKR